MVKLLKQLSPHRICDLGSGNGNLAGALTAAGWQVVGVERDATGVEISRRTHPDIPFYCMSVEDDPGVLLAAEDRFDAVVSTEVVEHLFAPHLLPAFARRLLVPGGYLIVSTPYHGYLKNLALSLADKWDDHHTPLWHGGHIKFWSRATLTQLLEDNGFRVTAFSGVGRLPYLWKSMVLVAQAQS